MPKLTDLIPILNRYKNTPFNQQIFFCIFLAIFSSCAQIVAPTGGPKDKEAPKAEKEYPPNKSTNFTDKKITLHFNEYVSLNNATEQVIISPPVEEKPDMEISGKDLNIRFRKPLAPNTTYTINFGNAIGDLHENNILPDYRYVFSTGPVIDTFKIQGTVYNAFDNKPQKDLLVGLYPIKDFNDSTIYKTKPSYFAKTKESGSFTLENIPEENFRLIAFNDANKNLKYDKNEIIGYQTDPVNPNDTLFLHTKISSFIPDAYPTNMLLDTFTRNAGKFTFIVYKPTNLTIAPLQRIRYFTWYTKGKDNIDTLTIFPVSKDTSMTFTYTTSDSVKTIAIIAKRKFKNVSREMLLARRAELNDSLHITFKTPILSFDTTRIILKEDTIPVKYSIKLSEQADQALIYYPWTEKKKYTLQVKDSAFTDIYDQFNKGDKATWTAKSLKEYSSLKLNISLKTNKDQYILQLVDADEKNVFKELIVTASTEILYEYMNPGTFKVKLIKDLNKNGRWDNGDYFIKTQPEPVYYYPEPIVLRAYWDLEQTIDIDAIINSNPQ